jgi:DNA-binding NarL/FixJ family response regulator
MNTLEILIADDHELIREGLKTRLEKQPGWKVCGEAVNGRHAVEMARELKPNVVVLDISMPELNGIEAARQIRKLCPESEVLILTMQESEGLVRDVLQAGARGFILKTDTTRLLINAIEALAQHKPFFTGKVSELVLGGFLDRARVAPHGDGERGRLSPRECEIIQLIAEGRSNKEVATQLGISVKTVDAHRTNIMRRLNLHSVAELVRYAIRERIIEP